MASRGRPRHPDILTPREWEVLELVRAGASNSQIAERLGITERTAKFHVSEILSKLGVTSREEAATVALPERRRWWPAWPLWARIAGAATVAATAAGLPVLAWGVLRTDGPTDAQQPPSTPKQGLILTSAENPVPWTDLPASSNAHPFTIPGVPPCQAADLQLNVSAADPSYIGAGPKDTSSWAIGVRNKAAPCFVGSTLDVGFATADGDLSLSAERIGGNIIYLENGPEYPGISLPSPGFGFSAGGEIDTFPCTVPPVTQMVISPGPRLGNATVKPGPAGGWGTPCAGETYRAQLEPEDCCSGSGYAVQTKIDAPAFAHPGERLRFFVTLLNEPPVTSCRPPCPDRSPAPLESPQCPTYHQELEGATWSFSSHRLNCEPVNPMPPQASATFEMYLEVPADAHPGPSVLSFGFEEGEVTYQQASINVWIAP